MRRIDRLLQELSQEEEAYIHDLSDPSIKMTYHSFYDEIICQTEQWRKRGIKRGASVLLVLPSGICLLTHILSLLNLGAAPSPVSNRLSPSVYQIIVKNIRPQAVYTKDSKFISELTEYSKEERHGLSGDYTYYINNFLFINNAYENGIFLTSSGSTGYPKSILHSGDSLLLNAIRHMDAIETSTRGTYLSSLSCFFSYGLVAGIFGALIRKMNIIITEVPFFTKQWFDCCNDYDVTLSSLTPGLLKKILQIGREIPKSLRKITIGGEHAIIPDIIELEGRFAGEIYLTYGLSEAGPRVFTNKITEDQSRWGEMGNPLNGVMVSLAADYASEGFETGELMVKTSTVMKGYVEDGIVKKAREIIDGWLMTGDVCKRNIKNNTFTFLERKKNIIKLNGEIVYPGVVREVLCRHEAVEEAIIDIESEPNIGEYLIAYIKLKKDCSVPDLKRYLARYLRYLEIPKKYIICSELEYYKK